MTQGSGMTRRQIVIGDGKQGPPYPEDLEPNARITNRGLLAAIRKIQEDIGDLDKRINTDIGNLEKRIKANADKAHTTIGLNIARLDKKVAKLATEVAGIGEIKEIVSATDSKVDSLHGWMKRQDERLGELEDRVY